MARAKIGRPSLIDAKKRQEIITATKTLGSRTAAAAWCKISYSTLSRAFHADASFAEALSEAVELFKTARIAEIAKAGGKDWRASAWLLERKFTEEYGRRSADAMTLPQVSSLIAQLVSVAFKRLPKKYFKLIETDYQQVLNSIANGIPVAPTTD